MATTIQNFFNRAQDFQFSRDFLFRVKQIRLQLPDQVPGRGTAKVVELQGDKELVYAKTAALPGRNIENKTVSYFGQEFQIPGRSIYQNAAGYSIDFYHDELCSLRTKLEEASRATFDNETSRGYYGMPGPGSVVELEQIDKQLNPIRTIELIGASIRDIGDISYTIAEGTGEVITFPATFSYHFYKDFTKGGRRRRRG